MASTLNPYINFKDNARGRWSSIRARSAVSSC